MKNKITLIIISFCFTQIIKAQEGFEYVTTANNSDYYVKIERKTSQIFGSSQEFWLKYDNPVKKVKTKSGKYTSTGGGYTLAFMSISCDRKTHRTENIIKYNKSGNVIARDDFPIFEKKIVPGSVIETIYDYVCNKN